MGRVFKAFPIQKKGYMKPSGIIFSYKQDDFSSTGDLSSSHPDQRYPLGYAASVTSSSSEYETVYIYVQAPDGGCPINIPQQISSLWIAEGLTDVRNNMKVVVPQFAIGPNQYGFVLFKGAGRAYVRSSADGMAVGNLIKADKSIYLSYQAFYDGETTMQNATFGSVLETLDASETKLVDILLLGKEGNITA